MEFEVLEAVLKLLSALGLGVIVHLVGAKVVKRLLPAAFRKEDAWDGR